MLLLSIVFAAGCNSGVYEENANVQENYKDTRIATINILEPGLNTTTSEQTVTIKGQTDQEFIYIAGELNTPVNGIFIATTTLQEGLNIIPIYTSTSFTTTTINLKVTKVK